VAAVVCSNGRTDFVDADLPRVRAPTLLLVSSLADATVASVNRAAMAVLTCNKRLETVPGVGRADSDLPDITVSLAGHWFEHHLNRPQH